MQIAQTVYQHLLHLPPELQAEVLDFIQFLSIRQQQKMRKLSSHDPHPRLVEITLPDKPVACSELERLRQTCQIGDVVSPVDADWNALR